MSEILKQSTNKVTIVGKLLDISFATGKTKDGKPYERANMTVRVTQTYGGRTETSDIPVSSFATQFTKTGAANPAYNSIQELKTLKTAQNVGIDNADTVCMTSAALGENSYPTKAGKMVTNWQVTSSFFSNRKVEDTATFSVDMFIMDMHDEVDTEGDTTGRLIVKGGIVQYGGALDVVEFVVEMPECVEHISRYWQVNHTVNAKGRIRYTSVEEAKAVSETSWGEEVPTTSTKMVRELVIMTGDDESRGEDDENAYSPVEIKKAFNARKAKLEQKLAEYTAKNSPSSSKSAGNGWE